MFLGLLCLADKKMQESYSSFKFLFYFSNVVFFLFFFNLKIANMVFSNRN